MTRATDAGGVPIGPGFFAEMSEMLEMFNRQK